MNWKFPKISLPLREALAVAAVMPPLPKLSRPTREALAIAAVLALVPVVGHAQDANSVVNFFIDTYGRGLVNAGIICTAVMFLLMRFNPAVVCGVAGGGLLFSNRDTVAGLFGM